MAGSGLDSQNRNGCLMRKIACGPLSEAQFLYYIKHCPTASAIFDRDMVCLACSDRFLQYYGLSEAQVIGKKHYDVFPEIARRYRDTHQRVLQGAVEKNDYEITRLPNGSICFSRWECRPWYDAQGEIGGIILHSDEITDQVHVLQEAKDQAELKKRQLETVISNMNCGVVAIDMHRNIIHVNDSLARILGHKNTSEITTDTNVYQKVYRLYSYPEKKLIPLEERPLERMYRGETVGNKKYIFLNLATGRERIVESYGNPILNENGELELGLLMVDDITDRQLAEEELRQTKEFAEQEQAKWQTILNHVSNGVGVFDGSGNQIYANDMQIRMYGYQDVNDAEKSGEFIRSNFIVQTYPAGETLIPEKLPSSRVMRGEFVDRELFRIKRLDRTIELIVMISGIPVYNAQGDVELAVLVSNDMTELVEREKHEKLVQKRMEQTQRLESLGVLAGGIAHDFNNLLMAILGHADLALLKLPQSSPIAKNLNNILTASTRAADLCAQLLAYSGQGKFEEKEFSMTCLVRETVQMLKTAISKNCVLHLNLDEQLPLILGDSSQMRQIVMNFIINASDAIGDHNGTINISTSSMNCSSDYFSDGCVVKPENPGLYVTLEVSDNGPGMDKETLGRIFEPFFTTKAKGRGLGLSAVLGIVRSHSGGFKVDSKPGIGTTFQVFFPAVDTSMENLSEGIAALNKKEPRFVGKVLLIDDEESVRSICSSQLEALGLKVLTARDGYEGVEVYRNYQSEIDLVILDLSMPKRGGGETFQILRQLNPTVKVVLSSGFVAEAVTKRSVGEEPSGYLHKPFTLKQLSRVLSGLLQENKTTQ